MNCDLYNEGHPYHECLSIRTPMEHIDYLEGNRQGNNQYSNSYNPGRLDYPNYLWINQGQQRPQNPMGFKQNMNREP